MTIISTIISKYYTVHSSDSLQTQTSDKGKREPIEWEKTKIIRVSAFRGAMSYWGLARYRVSGKEFCIDDWLSSQARLAHQQRSPEEFARKVAVGLNEILSKLKFANPVDQGIGIHFTAYEYINNYWIPELFLISNWETVKYCSIRSEGVGVSRETYYVDPNRSHDENIASAEFRLKVHQYLIQGRLLIYNNGDPVLFNPIANGILGAVGELSSRGKLRGIRDAESHIALVQRPIEVISAIQRDYCREGTRLVGGKPHNIAINSTTGEYYSTSGD